MLSRDDALDLIRNAYAARVQGDKDMLGRYWADGAHFEVVGDRSLLPDVPLKAATPMEAISGLIDRFTFSDLEMRDSIVEGNRIAVRWRVTIAAAGKPPQTTQLCDLITLDPDGKIRSFIQFADTALVRHLAS
jgi:ketosteroid isomerase-like protein